MTKYGAIAYTTGTPLIDYIPISVPNYVLPTITTNDYFIDTNFSIDKYYKSLLPKPIKVIYNNPATIVFWDDKTKTVVVCDEDDTFNEETGFLMCLGKKLFGKHDFFKMLDKFCYKEK